MVLIDGNSMFFHEVLAHDREFGGRRSALRFKSDIAKWVPDNLISPPSEYKIMVKVFVDFRLLSKLYGDPEVQAFARGFNSFGDLVDCGGGDPTDKVIGMYRLLIMKEAFDIWRAALWSCISEQSIYLLTFIAFRPFQVVRLQLQLSPGVAGLWSPDAGWLL